MATKSIFEYIDGKAVLDYARSLTPDPFFGITTLFPIVVVPEIEYEYIVGAGGQMTHIMAEPVAWDAAAPLVTREGFSKVAGELLPLKQMSTFHEKEIVKIFNPRSTFERDFVINKLYNEIADRVSGIYARLNWYAYQALSEGKITLAGAGVKVVLDWSVPGGHKVSAGTKWDQGNSTPLANLQTWCNTFKADTGVYPDVFLTSTAVLQNMLANSSVKTVIFGTDKSGGILTLAGLNNYLESVGFPRIVVDDHSVKTQGKDGTTTTARYFNEKLGMLFNSNDTLGNTLLGPTAEGIRSLSAEQAPGIWAEVIEQSNPVTVSTYANAVGLPTFPGKDRVMICTVLT